MAKISIALLQNQLGILFEDVLLCKIMNLLFLVSKYLAIFFKCRFLKQGRTQHYWKCYMCLVYSICRGTWFFVCLFNFAPFLLNKIGNTCIILFAKKNKFWGEAVIFVSFGSRFGRGITDGLNRNVFDTVKLVCVFKVLLCV